MSNYKELVEELRDKYNEDRYKRLTLNAADAIEELQARLPKQGKWVRVENEESYHYECSRCGERPLYSRYGDVVLSGVCPMCGAKMNDSNALNALDNAQDGPIITPCRGCSDYDGYGGCKSKGGCARAKMEVQE